MYKDHPLVATVENNVLLTKLRIFIHCVGNFASEKSQGTRVIWKIYVKPEMESFILYVAHLFSFVEFA